MDACKGTVVATRQDTTAARKRLPSTIATSVTATATANPTHTGAESFLVGLSPTYWSHVPLLIRQIHSLRLVGGVHCLVQTAAITATEASAKPPPLPLDGDSELAGSKTTTFIPVSRCKLVGCVVFVEYKANGSVLMVLDDGTGLMDCVMWDDGLMDDALPSLKPSRVGHADTGNSIQVGNVVQVLGRIECPYVGTARPSNHHPNGDDDDHHVVEICVREIHASLVQPILVRSRAVPNSLDAESRHWWQCCHANNAGLYNATTALAHLGPTIADQVCQKLDFPSADDRIAAWKLFGSKCPCDLPFKSHLLYCHCIATSDPLDSQFLYRDALLNRLLAMENIYCATRSSGNHCTGENSSSPAIPEHLRFQYHTIATDESLYALALQQVQSKKEAAHVHATRLMLHTMRILRQDGILYLVDEDSDTYLLISRQRVLEPYMRFICSQSWEGSLERASLKKCPPDYLRHVPKARLQLVRRIVAQGSQPEIYGEKVKLL